MLILSLTTLLNLFISSNSLLTEVLGFSIHNIMSFANSNSFTSFPIEMPFTSFFFCLINLAIASNTMLNRSGKCSHHFLIPDLSCGLVAHGLCLGFTINILL